MDSRMVHGLLFQQRMEEQGDEVIPSPERASHVPHRAPTSSSFPHGQMFPTRHPLLPD